MAYLMHIGFDNSRRLRRNIYYFEYRYVRFKLIQNNTIKWQDVLLTIIPEMNDDKRKTEVYLVASDFLSALAWENKSMVKLQCPGGRTIPDNFRLRNAKRFIRTFTQIPYCGRIVGFDICRIPWIQTEEQKSALTLYREASASNNDYLAFLFFWQILEIGKSDPIGWINKAWRKNRNKIRVTNSELKRLPKNGKDLGHYFYDDCRNAISHIHGRKKGKVRVKLDTPADNTRIAISTRVIKEFARFYIESALFLNKKMYLLRKRGKGFPVYVNEQNAGNFPGKIAYP